jgi:hypothetical protein
MNSRVDERTLDDATTSRSVGPHVRADASRHNLIRSDVDQPGHSLYARVPLLFEAFVLLLLYDLLSKQSFRRVDAFTRDLRVKTRRNDPSDWEADVRWAVDEACIWYWKHTFCLQRSSVVTWMLRRRGIAAELVIAYRPIPMQSHAWVEVDGRIINDRPQYQKVFTVLDRL